MKTILIGSTEASSGKSAICLGLAILLKETGYKVGYMKPLGNKLKMKNGKLIDEDADNFRQILDLDESLDDITPINLTDDFLYNVLKGEVSRLDQDIRTAFADISQKKDIVLIEGNAAFCEGAIYDMTDADVAHLLDASILLVARYKSVKNIDNILRDYKIINEPERMMGVILNMVPQDELLDVEDLIRPYLSRQGINVLGVLPKDFTLRSLAIGQMAERLPGRILVAEEKKDDLVEHILVGAMETDSALGFFRRSRNYAVVTGGDRADIQLAAMEANVKCLILTGNLYPTVAVLGTAQTKGVPIILVSTDTMTTIDHLEMMMGRSSISNPEKQKKIVELLKENIDMETVIRNIGSAEKT
jgi:BioD-like phosphotransacetylase family protein